MNPTMPSASAFRRSRPLLIAAVAAVVLLQLAVGCDCTSNPTQPPVNIPPIGQVIIAIQADTLAMGQQVTYAATVLDTSGAPVGVSATWTSGNTSVFTVTSAGQVTAQSPGTADLIASLGGKADTASVTVIQGAGWVLQQSGTSSNLNGVFFQPDGRTGWAVGSGGWIVHTTNAGVSWVRQQSNATVDLFGVWFVSATEGFAVGGNGTVRHTVNGGTSWDVLITGVAGFGDHLYDVFFATADSGWAVGAGGVVIATYDRGLTWTRRNPTTFSLQSVAFAGGRDGWAVGDNGTIVGTHNGGVSWFVVTPTVTTNALQAIWRLSESQAWAGGLAGAVPFTFVGADSTSWMLGNAGANNQIYGVNYPTGMIGWAVGLSSGGAGIVLRTDDGGGSWQPQTSSTNFRLNDVYFVNQGRGWVVGNNGVILHTGTGGL